LTRYGKLQENTLDFMKRPTQKDVARRAGVSRSTMSYVLNDQTDLKVPISAETRQRVLQAIAELGYEPDGSSIRSC
jgi:LacI family transcriptional regulator